MPRCCATINDPANPSNVLVFVEVNSGNSDAEVQAGLDAAQQAAQAAYAAANGGQAAPATTQFTLPGKLTHATVDLGSV